MSSPKSFEGLEIVVAAIAAFSTAACGCGGGEACMTGVQIKGSVQQTTPAAVDYELCFNEDCVTDTVPEQTSPGVTRCALSTIPFESRLCVRWPDGGRRAIDGEVNLGRSNITPRDGDQCTLRLVDNASGSQIGFGARSVTYESTGGSCGEEGCRTASFSFGATLQ